MGAVGHRMWVVPDGYLPPGGGGEVDSHEALCVLNAAERDAHVTITVFFEDCDPLGPFHVGVPARRTRHARLDELADASGQAIPTDVPYAMILEADTPVVAQHSRMDTRAEALTLMTTMAFPVDR